MPDHGFETETRNPSPFESQLDQDRPRLYQQKLKILLNTLLLGVDIFALMCSFLTGDLVFKIYNGSHDLLSAFLFYDTRHQINFLTFIMLSAVAIRQFHVYGHYNRRLAFWDEIGSIIFILSTTLALNAAIAFTGKWQISRLWMFSAWIIALLLVPLFRWIALEIAWRTGLLNGPTVILGCGANAYAAIRALAEEKYLGCQPDWLIVPPGAELDPRLFPSSMEILELGDRPLQTLADIGNPLVIAALDPGQWEPMQDLVGRLGLSYPNLILSPPLRRLPLCGLESMHFFGHDVLMLRPRDNLAAPGSRMMKRVFDIVVATLLLVLLSPVFLYIARRIRRIDRGSAYYSQSRIGRNGRVFPCFKFRSMVINADEVLEKHLAANPYARHEYSNNFKLTNDPRITPFGAFLRRSSLDELPQLFNVLRGEMSLVGPRPVTGHELTKYYENLSTTYYRVLPGMTGLWQISGRNNTTYAQRISYDVWYVKNWTLWYDIVILLRTFKAVTRRTGAY